MKSHKRYFGEVLPKLVSERMKDVTSVRVRIVANNLWYELIARITSFVKDPIINKCNEISEK